MKKCPMKITKTLCCLDRDQIKDNLEEIAEIVAKPKYICRKCARVAGKKKYLCKPMKLKAKE